MNASRLGRWGSYAAIAALSAGAVVGGGALPATAKEGDVIKRAACSAKSVTKLKLSSENGRIETEFEVDSNRNGQRWNVAIYSGGATKVSTTAVTRAPSGSFTVRTLLANGAGRETVKGLAKNRTTGEVCRVTATW
jgi:hypothetical protein